MIFSDKIRVGVLRGGPSPEYQVSLDTGASVLENLDSEIYEPLDILISKSGVWHSAGIEKSPEKALKGVDVVFNALHGKYGEDGTVQKVIEQAGIPYSGSGVLASALGINKVASKEIFKRVGLKMPYGVVINLKDLTRGAIRQAYHSVPPPFVVKPSSAGSSVGVRIVESLPELEEAVVAAFEYSPSVLIEEYIAGQEATCGVVEGFRMAPHYALLPIEIKPGAGSQFFDYNSKYLDGGAEEICPGNFTREEKDMIEAMAVSAHRALDLRHYSRSDFRVSPKRGVFILEANTLPGLTKNSLIPKALRAAGSSISEFLHHIVSLAMKRHE